MTIELVLSLPSDDLKVEGGLGGDEFSFKTAFLAITRGFLDLAERLATGVDPAVAFAADFAFKEELSIASVPEQLKNLTFLKLNANDALSADMEKTLRTNLFPSGGSSSELPRGPVTVDKRPRLDASSDSLRRCCFRFNGAAGCSRTAVDCKYEHFCSLCDKANCAVGGKHSASGCACGHLRPRIPNVKHSDLGKRKEPPVTSIASSRPAKIKSKNPGKASEDAGLSDGMHAIVLLPFVLSDLSRPVSSQIRDSGVRGPVQSDSLDLKGLGCETRVVDPQINVSLNSISLLSSNLSLIQHETHFKPFDPTGDLSQCLVTDGVSPDYSAPARPIDSKIDVRDVSSAENDNKSGRLFVVTTMVAPQPSPRAVETSGVVGASTHMMLSLPFVLRWLEVVKRNPLTSTYFPSSDEWPNVRPTTFRVDVFEALTLTSPFEVEVRLICEGFRHGFDTGYRFVQKSPGVLDSIREFPNPPSSVEQALAISRTIANEFAEGYIGGGTCLPPFPDAVVSPIRAIPKKECTVPTGKFRLIHNLTKGSASAFSVNECIDKNDFPIHYSCVDDAIRMIQRLGSDCRLSKIDIKAAFRLLCVRQEFWRTMVYKWEGKYYFETRLPFGLRSAPSIFEMFSSMLHWILENCAGVRDLVHYADDFLLGGPPGSAVCSEKTELLLAVFDLLGVPVNLDKLIVSVTTITFLGIGLDTVRGVAFVPDQRLKAMKSVIQEWKRRSSCTKGELLSLIGLLQFAAKVVKPGRTFLRRMIDLAHSVESLFHHISIDRNFSFRGDLDWWDTYLDKWNGESLFYDDSKPSLVFWIRDSLPGIQ
jgi:hypothetical protein